MPPQSVKKFMCDPQSVIASYGPELTILYFIFGNYYELKCCENSVDPDQLASSEAS